MIQKTAIIALADGFEEVEALGTADVLIRNGIRVILAGINGISVQGAHGIRVNADLTLAQAPLNQANALILPGGMPGATTLRDCAPLGDALRAAKARGAVCAAICAAPIALHSFGVIDTETVTGYPGCEALSLKPGLVFTGAPVEHDGNVITGKAPGATFAFASEIALALGVSPAASENVLKGMFVKS